MRRNAARGFRCLCVSLFSCQVPPRHVSRRHGRGLGRTLFQAEGSLSRKEVFQPHLPVRLPCYDLAPVTCLTLGRSSRSRTSGTPGFHGLTGGVYKARERIHRAMADARLLANFDVIPAFLTACAGSLSRVPGFNRWQLKMGVALVMALKPTPHGTS